MRSVDFAGCVQTVTGGLSPKQKQDVEDGLRTWTRDDGSVIRMCVSSVKGLRHKGSYGRYITYKYGLKSNDSNTNWTVQADCRDYTANWDKDNSGWDKVKDPDMCLKNGEASGKYGSAMEAKAVLDEFCPIIDTLPKGGSI